MKAAGDPFAPPTWTDWLRYRHGARAKRWIVAIVSGAADSCYLAGDRLIDLFGLRGA